MASPILSNIYLHKLDEFVEKVLIPAHTRGDRRARDAGYHRLVNRRADARARGDSALAKQLLQHLRAMPRVDPNDPGYRRLRYVRYADDHLLGFTGPKAEAEQIKLELATFLREELKLELSPDKTLITHARTGAARFLGYEITTLHDRSNTQGLRAWSAGTSPCCRPCGMINDTTRLLGLKGLAVTGVDDGQGGPVVYLVTADEQVTGRWYIHNLTT